MKPRCCIEKKLIGEFSSLARFLRIIGDDNRLRILCLLKDGEKCVCEIYPNLNLAQNLVSSHLKVMLDLGLLKCRQEWKKNYYSVNKKVFKRYVLTLKNFFRTYEQ